MGLGDPPGADLSLTVGCLPCVVSQARLPVERLPSLSGRERMFKVGVDSEGSEAP